MTETEERQTTLVVGTDRGLVFMQRAGDGWRVSRRALVGQAVRSVSAGQGVLLAGTRQGIQRSRDGGQTWLPANSGLTLPHVRWLATQPDAPHNLFAGVEPAAIFVSSDGGASWHERTEVARLRDQHGWFLPYSPAAGCVRGFAMHGQRVFAACEVGGVLRSDDGGETWRLAAGSDGRPSFGRIAGSLVHPDVHSIIAHAGASDLVFAPTGGGFYSSHDGGARWQLLYECYCRAAWVDPLDPGHMILGPAAGVSRGGRIEQTRDGGRTWRDASTGLDAPWPQHMVERFLEIGNELVAVLSNGELAAGVLPDLAWQRITLQGAEATSAVVLPA